MNADVMNCYKYLQADKPKKPTASAADWTKDCLRKVGWHDDDLLPDGLDNYIAAVLDVLHLPRTRRSVEDIFELDEVKLTLSNAIQTCNAAVDADDAESKVKEQFKNADMSNPVNQELYKLAVDTEKYERAKAAENFSKEKEVVIQDVKADYTPKEEQKEVKIDLNKKFCPRCGLDLELEYKKEPLTEDDRRRYLVAILGGKPFFKEMELFGGLVKATFTMLTTEQEDLIRDQIGWLTIHRPNEAAIISTMHLDDSRLALQVTDITSNVKDIVSNIKQIPSIDSDVYKDDDESSRLEKYTKAWYNNVVTTQPLRNELRNASIRFNKLIADLSNEAMSPDFWPKAVSD